METGIVEGIFLADEAGADPRPVSDVLAVAGRGLEGDRYFAASGTFSDRGGDGRDVTLIEAEAIEGLARDTGIELSPGAARRNVVTRGVSLNDLVGKRFTLGEAQCVGRRLCDPCDHLERLTAEGVLEGLVNRGGLRADVVEGGLVSVGAPLHEQAE
jgi:MOSC domain-containing protein YiiM